MLSKREKRGISAVEEIQEAETILLEMVQEESFGNLKHKDICSCPFKDERGIIRVKTKVSERNDTCDLIYPVLLPSRHPVTEKIIYHYHLKLYRVGVQ